MDKIKCIAIDDEPFALEIIGDDISKIPYLELIGKFSSTAAAKNALEGIDLIFLDIQMPSQSGISFLRAMPKPPMVIFTTAFEQYALEGFELKVIDYLLKPIPFERFLQATEHAKELFALKNKTSLEKHFLIVFSEYKQIKIYSEDIQYVEGLKDYVKINLKNQEKPILTRLNMKGILEKLPENDFCRVHNSFIVPLDQIQSFQKNEITLLADIQIPVGSRFLEGFMEKIRG